MSSFNGKIFYFACFNIDGLLHFRSGRSRLDSNAKNQFIIIGNTANNTAGMISSGFTLHVFYRIIVIAAIHPCRGKAGSKFNTPHGRDCKYRMADNRFSRIKKWLAQTNGQAYLPCIQQFRRSYLLHQWLFAILFPYRFRLRFQVSWLLP